MVSFIDAYWVIGTMGVVLVLCMVAEKVMIRHNLERYVPLLFKVTKYGLIYVFVYMGLLTLHTISNLSGLHIPYLTQVMELIQG